MYLTSVRIENIRNLQSLTWEISPEKAPGWHVLIGDNGTGKTAFLRATALALIGPSEAAALRQDWNQWLRRGQGRGCVSLVLEDDPAFDVYPESEGLPTGHSLKAGLDLKRHSGRGAEVTPGVTITPIGRAPERSLWGGQPGWFSASYGPFRRFSGGTREDEKIFNTNPSLAAHISAFGESVALAEIVDWLQQLRFKELEQGPEQEHLGQITRFVNQNGLLPYQVKLQVVTSSGVVFTDGYGSQVLLEELSDGYRSILSMTFELIRQMFKAYPGKPIFSEDFSQVIVPGVVLIDEVDAHLHPSWQHQIGLWFREHFPRIQFIVTTHSPFVCQAADVGTVYRLPKPGSKEKAGMVTGADLDRLLFGNVLDAYSTDLFGEGATRSEEAKKRQLRLAELNMAELMRDLKETERAELESLRSALPTAAHSLPVGANGAK